MDIVTTVAFVALIAFLAVAAAGSVYLNIFCDDKEKF